MRHSLRNLCLMLAALPCAVQAVDLIVYDEALQNGFQDFSYGGGANFASTAQAHGGTKSISFVGAGAPNAFNALSFYHTPAYATAAYPVVHFWVHGGSAGGQQLYLFLQNNGGIVAQGELDPYINGGAIVAATWKEVTVPLTTGALAYNGSYDRIDLQSDSSNAQPVLYVDDVVLQPPVVAPVDGIFRNGFESSAIPPAANGLVQDHDVSVSSMVSDRFTWRDAGGKPRVAVLAHNDQLGPQAPGGYVNHGGSLREFQYVMPDNSTRTAGLTTFGNGGLGGFGYVVSHSAWLSNGACNGDDSPLGYTYAGNWTRVFEGRHHAIFRFTQNYERHCGPTNPAPTTLLPVTIDWVFSTGHDNPLWAITYNMAGIAADFLDDDSRAPYGELVIDGIGAADIEGVAWGDKFKFSSTSTPLTLNSSWTWNVANTVPYVKEWIASTNATMGLVQTQTLAQQDAGAGRNPNFHDLTPRWGTTSAAGNAGGTYLMPWQDDWPYQANADNLGPATSNNYARLTWGTQYGFLGQNSYASNTNTAPGNDGPFLSGYPKKSYSVHVILGAHTLLPVEAQLAQVETVQGLTISAIAGTVATTGPAGVNRSGLPTDTITYAPAGYDPVYTALSFDTPTRALDANVAVASGSLKKPLLILRNYNGAYPTTVRFNGAPLVLDVDYFPSLRVAANELWITLNRDLSGVTNHVEVIP